MPEPIRMTSDILLEESQHAVDASFELWQRKRRDLDRLIRLKNAIDHLYNVERRLTVGASTDDAFGGVAGR